MKRTQATLSLVLAGALGLTGPSAFAQDAVSDDWSFTVTPYLWGLAADGDVTVDGQKSDLDIGFDDLLDELNYGVMLEGEVRKGRFGVLANVLYADLGHSTNIGAIDIDPDLDVFWGSLAGFYRLGPWDLDGTAGEEGPKLIVDAYAGLRYTYADLDLDISPGPDVGGHEDWVDPIIGLRTIWALTPRWNLSVHGDIGGFGVGSDFAWQATGLVGYRFDLFGERDANVLAGYRALHQDYSTGSGANKFEYDATLHGPVVALMIEF